MCPPCQGERYERSQSQWTPNRTNPPNVGVIADTNQVVSFKTNSSGETLIADGDYSDRPRAFNNEHNHYGEREDGSTINWDRGYYTGPDA